MTSTAEAVGTARDFESDEWDEFAFAGRPVRVRFVCSGVTTPPRWEQALSGDDGATWETNWTMDFTRREGAR